MWAPPQTGAAWLHQVKRVADVGAPSDSRVVHGLVFRKNVVHKLMRSHIAQPRIMMLGSMLEYHRTTGKLSSFDTLLEQVRHATHACTDLHSPLHLMAPTTFPGTPGCEPQCWQAGHAAGHYQLLSCSLCSDDMSTHQALP